MNVVWLLAVFIAIVTCAPKLIWSRAGNVSGKRVQNELGPISCEQSDICLTQ